PLLEAASQHQIANQLFVAKMYMASRLGNKKEVEAFSRRALSEAQATGDPRNVAYTYDRLAQCSAADDPALYESLLRRGLDCHRHCADLSVRHSAETAWAASELSRILASRKQLGEAIQLQKVALEDQTACFGANDEMAGRLRYQLENLRRQAGLH